MSAAQAGQCSNGGDGGAQGGDAGQAQGFDAAALQAALAPIVQGQDQLRQ